MLDKLLQHHIEIYHLIVFDKTLKNCYLDAYCWYAWCGGMISIAEYF